MKVDWQGRLFPAAYGPPPMTTAARTRALVTLRQRVLDALEADGVAVLSPLRADVSLGLCAELDLGATLCMLDPWYNKGFGGLEDDAAYDAALLRLLAHAARLVDHTYLWGFPEIVARLIGRFPEPLRLEAWLTWFYKNNPSVIRGWRSAQNACLHLVRPGATMHPEHFMNEAQKAKQAEGKLRYLPGPPSVIEAGLLVGFIGRNEQTGHPSQKPEAVYRPLVEMATVAGDLVIDPMAGSGTTGAVCRALGRRAVLCDGSADYIALIEHRLDVRRIRVPVVLSR